MYLRPASTLACTQKQQQKTPLWLKHPSRAPPRRPSGGSPSRAHKYLSFVLLRSSSTTRRDPVQVQVLGHVSQDRVRAAVVSISAVHPAVRRHARVRMVCARTDLRLQHHALLRGHPPGQEQGAEAHPLLDEPCLLHDLHHRNVLEVDRAGVYQVFLQLLDDPGLCDRIRMYSGRANRVVNFNFSFFPLLHNPSVSVSVSEMLLIFLATHTQYTPLKLGGVY